IAIHFAKEMEQDWTILWVNAQSKESIQSSYAQLLRDFAPWAANEDVAEEDLLSRHLVSFLHHFTWIYPRCWVMILDGLDTPGAMYLKFSNLLPRSCKGTFLFTTQYP